MVVQYILAARKGRREVKPENPSETSVVEKKPDVPIESKELSEVPAETNEAKAEIEKACDENVSSVFHDSVKTEDNTDFNIKFEVSGSNTEGKTNPDNVSVKQSPPLSDTEKANVSQEEEELEATKEEASKPEDAALDSNQSIGKKEVVPTAAVSSSGVVNKQDVKYIEVEEYYVKYRNFSYLHCEWKTEEELYKGDKRISAKLKRFKQKMAHQTNIFENVSRC